MAVPDFQSIMLPMLNLCADQLQHTLSDCVKHMEEKFNLTDEEKAERIPSGRQRLIYNRTAWAGTYLRKAGVMQAHGRGVFSITQKGLDLLATQPDIITVKLLMDSTSYLEFRTTTQPNIHDDSDNSLQTPEESIGILAEKLNGQLADDILEVIIKNSPSFFEQLVVDLLVKMGYGGYKGAGLVTGQTGDGGIDGIIQEDTLGLDSIYIQAKKWDRDTTVGRPEIQKFVGALMGKGASKGVFITSSSYSRSAIDYANNIKQAKIVLLDGLALSKLMIQYDLGVSINSTIHIKKIDVDYFEAT